MAQFLAALALMHRFNEFEKHFNGELSLLGIDFRSGRVTEVTLLEDVGLKYGEATRLITALKRRAPKIE